MTDQDQTAMRLTQYVSASLARLRRERRMTYTEISARLAELGQPIPTIGLTRMEKGERRVDIDEVVALAQVFGVPPITLMFPIGHATETELLPGQRVEPWLAAKWFVGKATLGDEAPSAEAKTFALFEQHDALMDEAGYAHMELAMGPQAEDHPDRAPIERRWRIALRDLRYMRAQIRNLKMEPPPLEEGLEMVDDSRYKFLTRTELASHFPNAQYPPGLVVEDHGNGNVWPVDFGEKGARPRDAGEGR